MGNSCNKGISLERYDEILRKHHDQMLMMNDYDVKKLLDYIENFEKMKRKSRSAIGAALEYIAFELFNQKYFDISINERTSTNEIDLLLELSITGHKIIDEIPYYKDFPKSIIIESKNYNKKVDVTYVGKLKSLMESTSIKLGIFISYKGLAGRDSKSWYAAKGLTKIIAVSEKKIEDKYIILDINIDDIKEFLQDEPNLLKFLKKKREDFIKDVERDLQYISKHPLEDKIKKLLKD